MTPLQTTLQQMEPAKALAEIAPVLGDLLSHQSEEERLDFLKSILGDAGESKVGSMVHL